MYKIPGIRKYIISLDKNGQTFYFLFRYRSRFYLINDIYEKIKVIVIFVFEVGFCVISYQLV